MKTIAFAVAATLLAAACDGRPSSGPPRDGTVPGSAATSLAPPETPRPDRRVQRRPPWLGTRILPRTPSGYGRIRPTPPGLRNRRFPTVDVLSPPQSRGFEADIRPIPLEILERSTWSARCPVGRRDLRYLTMSFWGFDRAPHTGEMIVHESAARPIVGVFRRLYRARFPIEEMRVVAKPELSAPPTGDGNNTTAFVCRPARGSASWSEHAFGLAVDVNPFHNPYHTGSIVLPELASAYTDRRWRRPGMIVDGDVVTRAFAAIGWSWGGEWTSLKDWMHFSAAGR